MKKAAIVILLLAGLQGYAQEKAPAGFVKGSIVTANGTTEGLIKENFKRGTIEFKNSTGENTTYTPSDLQAFTINTETYTAYKNDFYKVLVNGSKGKLYQKATDNNGKIVYNGSEPVSLSTTDGKTGSYYLSVEGKDTFILVTAKNFEKVMATHCADCAAVAAKLQAKEISYAQLTNAVELYNSCN